jgi:hypothetical protein
MMTVSDLYRVLLPDELVWIKEPEHLWEGRAKEIPLKYLDCSIKSIGANDGYPLAEGVIEIILAG